MEIQVFINGITPLVMHNIRLADPEDPITREIAEISGKRKKTDADLKELGHLEFLGGLYFDEYVGFYLPSRNIIRCVEQAGKATRMGTAVVRAVSMLSDKVPLIHDGPETPEELWDRPEYRFRTMVGVKTAKISRTRPIFRQWALSFNVELVDTIMNARQFEEIMIQAGRSEGLGDARKLGNGRFEATVTYQN